MFVDTCISVLCSIWMNENKNIYKEIENNVCTRVTNCFSAQERVILVFINTKKQNIRVSKKTVRHESTYNILFLTRHNESINVEKTTILTSSPCLTRSVPFCWWHYNRLLMMSQWPDNCGVITWIVISNSLDIDFIHGDIHGWSHNKAMSTLLERTRPF